MLLETTYEALESAGVRQEDIQGSNTAVYMAIFTRDYDRNVYKDMMSIPKYQITGTGDAILANRISHLFDLSGPSVTMDTGCSGGMTAINQACQALRLGDADMALAGAANLILTPDHSIAMSNLHMLNKDGRSYSFDSRGNGYGRGEGIATIVIKRLEDAIKANDPIRAILLDASINQDGRTSGITLPSGLAQEALERRVWNRINLHPRDVSYVEAHGTGTLAGDSAELAGISRVFCSQRDHSAPLYVGSIKANIGHTECASGIAAIIKGVLVLEHNQIPPNINLMEVRANLDLEEKKIAVPQSLVELPQSEVSRVSVNSFGYGGTNAHAVLERYERSSSMEEAEEPRLFTVTAASQISLQNTMNSLADWISDREDRLSLRDLAYTLGERRSVMPWRHTSVATSAEELVTALRKSAKSADTITRASSGIKIGYVFSGQGAQWAGMGRELISHPTFRESLKTSNNILKELGSSWDLLEELFREKETSRLKEAELAQPATTAIQIALVDMNYKMGVQPDAVVGHSSGEIAAAYAAGYISHDSAIKAAYFRGFSSSVAKLKGLGAGGMAAVGVGETEIAPYLRKLTRGKAVVACQNSPSSATISGDNEALTELEELLKGDSIFYRRLVVDTAYHSHHMEAAAETYHHSIAGLKEETTRINNHVKMFSSVSGSIKESGFDADYWVANLVGRVRFCDAIQALCRADQKSSRTSQPHRIFIEIGPHAALAGPARQSIADLEEITPYTYSSALVRGTSSIHSVLTMAGTIFTRGFPLQLSSLAPLDSARANARVLHNLPSYAWDHTKKHWHESRLSKDYRFRKHGYHDLLGLRMTDNSPMRPIWRHMVGVEGLPWLKEHVVDGLIIFPGSGYLCMAIEAALQVAADRHPKQKVVFVKLRDIELLKGLVIPDGKARVELQLAFDPIQSSNSNANEHNFSVTAYTGDEHWNEHCRGSIAIEFTPENVPRISYGVTYSEVLGNFTKESAETLHRDELYQELNRVGNTYGKVFSGIREICIDDSKALFTASIPDLLEVMPAGHLRPHLIHPTTLDILLHSSLPLVNKMVGSGSVMPVHIGNMVVSCNIPAAASTVFSGITTLTSKSFRTAEADMVVFSGVPDDSMKSILSVSGMELRSLASDDSGAGEAADKRQICYTMQWVPDVGFISANTLKTSGFKESNLTKYLKLKALKQSELAVLELGSPGVQVASTVLETMQAQKAIPAVYDLATLPTQPLHPEVRTKLEKLSGPINFRSLDIEGETAAQGFVTNVYDIILIGDNFDATGSQLVNTRSLIKDNGTLLIHGAAMKAIKRWEAAWSRAGFKLQFMTDDDDGDILVAKAVSIPIVSLSVRFIVGENVSPTLKSITDGISTCLKSKGVALAVEASTSWTEERPQDDVINIVIDDGTDPILADVTGEDWSQIVGLLQGPKKIIWVSAQENAIHAQNVKKQLITGVARTAHAENDQLELVTVDLQQTLTSETSSKIMDFLADIVIEFPKKNIRHEREYVYQAEDRVLVPRVLPSETLNRQISNSSEMVAEVENFSNPQLSIKLNSKRDNNMQVMFTEDEGYRRPLEADQVEIEVKAFGVVPKLSQGGTNLNEYAGIVSKVGPEVFGFSTGDRVVAWDTLSLANHPRISASKVQLIPANLPFATAASLPLYSMLVARALLDMAAVQPGDAVLIDGAATDLGQFAVLLARYLGVRVMATVNRSDEATLLQDNFQVPQGDIISRENPFLYEELRKCTAGRGLDVVVGCSWSPLPNEVIKCLKKSGTLVQLRNRAEASFLTGTTTAIDLNSLAELNSRKSSQLFNLVMQMISEGLPVEQLQVESLSIDQLAQAFKQVRQGSSNKLVVAISDLSTVKVMKPSYVSPRLDPNATYVVSGGLGDLGRRFLRLMAKSGAQYLVTLSRSGSNSIQHEKVEGELQKFNSRTKLLCLKCDVSDESAVQAALSEISVASFPTVKGVIQASVVLSDSTLSNMSATVFESVLQAKAYGTLHLQKVFGGKDLNFFISLSSAVNMIGAAGEANYNAANSLQDALAQFNKDDNTFYMALNIGLIEDANVNSDVIVQSLQRQGLTPILSNELDAYFEYSLSEEARLAKCHQAIIGFTAKSVAGTSAANGNVKTLMFTHVHQSIKDNDGRDGEVEAAKTFKELVQETDDVAVLEDFIATAVAEQLADLMAIEIDEVQLDESVQDLGIDSLIAIELRNWIMREFEAPIQSSEVLDSPTIRDLAQKILSRSQAVTDDETASSNSNILPASTRATTIRASCEEPPKRMSPLPIPDLEDTLQMFADSRRAIGSSEELEELDRVVEEFKETGLKLQESLRMNPYSRQQFYDDNIHLERREALQDHATFFIGHLTDGAPEHSQSERAAIITVAALDFKKRYENNTLEQHTLNGINLDMETLQWLFHSVVEPGADLDTAQKYPSTNNVVVMRKGHFFEINVAEDDDYAALKGIFDKIIKATEDEIMPLSVLSSKSRNEWADWRSQLKMVPDNESTLYAIESSAFILCLDDSSPKTPSERWTSILLNDRHLTNRWLDKMVQFTVATNGVSALVGANTKLDGLSVRQLSEYITDEIFRTPSSSIVSASSTTSTLRELKWAEAFSVLAQAVRAQTNRNLAQYKIIGSSREFYNELSRSYLGAKGLRSKGTVLMAILMAVRLFYGHFEPVWETITLAKYAQARIDWLQTLTPDIAAWVEKALEYQQQGASDVKQLGSGLKYAAFSHVQSVRRVADGHGFVEPLYSLLGIATAEKDKELPSLFESAAWKFSDRHATTKRAKTDCLGSGGYLRMQEGGFLMPNPETLFIHYEVHHVDPLINVNGREEDVERFERLLRECVKTVRSIIDHGL